MMMKYEAYHSKYITLCKPSWATKIEWEEPEVIVDQLEDYIDWEGAYAYA